jgi:putative FmdB family regulatory protein
MPMFEYKCQQCGHVMEVLQKSRNATKQTCTECGSPDTKKLLSGFAVGQSRPSSAACDTCPTASACGGGMCPGGACPMS